jgi:hypothetical protein
VREPVVYGVQEALRQYHGAKEGPPRSLRRALAGRKIAFDLDSFKAAVDARISGIGNTIRIKCCARAVATTRSGSKPNFSAAP